MLIIDNCGGPLSYKCLMEAHMQAVLGRIQPTTMLCSYEVFADFAERICGYASNYPGFRVLRFEGADVSGVPGLKGEVWFHNPDHPEYDVLIQNIVVQGGE